MHVLDLIARSVKESIAEDDGSSFVEVLHQSFMPIRRDREWGPEVCRKAFSETRGFTIEKRFDIPFGYPFFRRTRRDHVASPVPHEKLQRSGRHWLC